MNPTDSTESGPDYDPDTDTYYLQRDGGNGKLPSWNVIETVAAATGTEPLRLQPLCEVVDPDSLDRLFEREDSEDRREAKGQVRFQFEGCSVTVNSTGGTIVSPPDTDLPQS